MMRISASDVRAWLLCLAGAVTCTWGLFLALNVAPLERELLASQKIFYFHAPLGIWTILGVVVAAGAAGAYLAWRNPRMDLLSATLMEWSTITCAVVVATGCVWAKFAWGDWFPWGEPRVTSMLLLFLIGVAYAVVRSSVDEPDRRARFSSVVAVLGAVDALLGYFVIHIWNTNHPRVVSFDKGVGLDPAMKPAFYVCILGTGLLFWAIARARYRDAALRYDADRLAYELEESPPAGVS